MTVRQKQWQLCYLGFLAGWDEIDGIWGEKSAAATMAFQKMFGIPADGIFGNITMEKTREMISALQIKLNVEADGLAGAETAAATREYQQIQKLPVTGVADGITRKRMEAAVQTQEETVADWWKEIRYFTREECRCKCAGRYCSGYPAEMQEEVLRVADRARAHFGRPGYVISGLRCRKHNENSGGVANSQHMFGEAMDLRIEGISSAELLMYLRKQPEVRYAYAIDSTNVHFDIPKKAR